MAKALQDTITIKFIGDGTGLEKTIQDLDRATQALIHTQQKIQDDNKKGTKTVKVLTDANRKLYLELKSKGITGFKDLGLASGVLTRALKGNKVALRKVRAAMIATTTSTKKLNTGISNATRKGRLLDNTFATLRSKLLLVNFALALGVRQLARFTKEASKLDSMGRAFNTLAGGSNKASIAMTKLQKATNNTMTQFDLFQQANNAMILGVSTNSDEMAEMFDMAQRLGDALGKGTKESVESLITGIGRQSRLMLDNIGIIVKSDEAYQSYADKLKITVDELSDADRKQAFLNATMDAAREKIANLPPEMLTAEMQFRKLGTSVSELSVRL